MTAPRPENAGHADSPADTDRADTVGAAVQMPQPHISERPAYAKGGVPMLVLSVIGVLVGLALAIAGAAIAVTAVTAPLVVIGVLLFLAAVTASVGLTVVAPGEARVLQLLGRYVGTLRTDGLRWVNPITTRRRISTRIRNHETAVGKVNDADGNPIEIAAVVVWKVGDTAQAVFEVDDFEEFVATQAETAVRHIAGSYPYEAHDEDRLSLRDDSTEITERLSREVADRVAPAGVSISESRLTHLAYASEIASAMLQRQQAGAVVAAREQIVEGAVGMVETALDRLSERSVVELDPASRAAMVSNLMVVLVGDGEAQPVVDAGSRGR